MCKIRFPTRRKSKLHSRGDGPFQVVVRVINNTYKLDLPGEYNVSATFNVFDLLPFYFEGEDSRANPFEEGWSDAYGHASTKLNSNPLNYNRGPITRSRAKRMKDATRELVQKTLEFMELNGNESNRIERN